MKNFLKVSITVFFWILTKFAVFSAIASAAYVGTWAGMFLHGLLWPYKLVYWVIKNLTLNTGFREIFADLGKAIYSGIVGLPLNLATDTIATICISGFFLAIHFFFQSSLRNIKRKINNKIG
jgi:hypothetical protein